MGLDMYLSREIYIPMDLTRKNDIIFTDKRHSTKVKIPYQRIKYIKLEGIYWRKANQIHGWFVDNVQGGEDNCSNYYVREEQLVELKQLCERILAEPDAVKREALSRELLPTREGFFFGSNEYNQDYYDDIAFTAKAIGELLENKIYLYEEYSYGSSW